MTLEIIDCAQGSESWLSVRCGLITASNFAAILSGGTGKTRRSYMMKLAGERITGTPAESYSNAHMERGKEQEPIARNLYIEHTGNEVKECGFMKLDSIGYSPDGTIGDDGLIEIKSKLAHLQAEVLLSDKVPPEHIAQIQGGLLVSGRKYLDFISYCPSMPIFIKRVERDETYISMLEKELKKFELELTETVKQIMEKF